MGYEQQLAAIDRLARRAAAEAEALKARRVIAVAGGKEEADRITRAPKYLGSEWSPLTLALGTVEAYIREGGEPLGLASHLLDLLAGWHEGDS